MFRLLGRFFYRKALAWVRSSAPARTRGTRPGMATYSFENDDDESTDKTRCMRHDDDVVIS